MKANQDEIPYDKLKDETERRRWFQVDDSFTTSDGKRVSLAPPELFPECAFEGRDLEMQMCQAAFGIASDWSSFDITGEPLHFRLEGPPGVGKNEIVYEVARRLAAALRMPFYSIQGHEEMTPEDLSILIVPQADSNLELGLRASPLATALHEGGLFFFDEINRAPERALTPLASVLDKRRSLYSAVTGITIQPKEARAHRFRFCCALNPDRGRIGRGGLDDYLEERTLPAIPVGYHDHETLEKILRQSVKADEAQLAAFRKWYEESNVRELSARQAIALMTFSIRAARHSQRPFGEVVAENFNKGMRKPQPAADTVEPASRPVPPLA
jgi:MoxR-like ATPase